MDKSMADRLDERKQDALAWLKSQTYTSYEEMVKFLASLNEEMDPERVTVVDHGHYQGTLVFVVGGKGYQPYRYWYVKVGYGSCSGCDVLQAVQGYGDEPNVEGLYSLLHDVASGFREMNTGDSVA